MPYIQNVRRKLAKYGYVMHERLSKDPIREKKTDSSSGKLYTLGIPGRDYWVDCTGNGRDIRYSWGADGSDWVPRLIVLSKKKTFTDPGEKLEKWLKENFFSDVPHGYSRKRHSKIKDLDDHGREYGSIVKAIDASRLGR